MLEKNRLQPPRSFETTAIGCREGGHASTAGNGPLFVSAEDFDDTGILAGIDPCASTYWWMPELQGPRPVGLDAVAALAAVSAGAAVSDSGAVAEGGPENPLRGPAHATRRTASRPIAAA